MGRNAFLFPFCSSGLPCRRILFISDYKSIRKMQKSKISQASQASRVTDFNMHECNVSGVEFIISSRFKVDLRFKKNFFLFPPGLLLLFLFSSSNPLVSETDKRFPHRMTICNQHPCGLFYLLL